jgi:Domain of unknown function (DUF4936)
MPLGRRQLFIYWRVVHEDLPMALEALRDWQAGLVRNHPALRCSMYQRCDGPGIQATVMEAYALESTGLQQGIDDTLRQHIEIAGHAVLQRWLRGERHVEVFDALDE